MADFPWEALATLVTGFAAVGAAVVVALKQNAIVARQTKLQELSLRSDIFDKRMATYREIRRYISHVTNAEHPDQLDLLAWLDFSDAMEDARFLFSKRLYLLLNSIQVLTQEFVRNLDYREYVRNGRAEKEPEDVDQDDWSEKRVDRQRAELKRRYHELPSLFDAEMNLRTVDESLLDYVADVQLPDTPDEIGALSRKAQALRLMASYQARRKSQARPDFER